jgi:oligoribonuclease NrnB/cAMP/cGMP phosphodiesterase (DHH superfamily)
MSILIIYHGFPCKDGFCAAWVLHKKYPDAEFMPGIHQTTESRPDVTGKDVIIVDFAYDRQTLLEMKEEANSLVVLDHHVGNEKDLVGLAFCTFDINKSGARLAWEYCFGDEPAPWLVEYTEDRDLWRWRLPDSKSVSAALCCYPHNFEVWDDLGKMNIEEFRQIGSIVKEYQNQRVTEICNNAREIEIAGHKILCANTCVLQSEVGNTLAVGRPFSATRFQLKDGRWQYSLRSILDEGGIDVSEIAAKFGGGGHTTAAGFVISVPRNLEMNVVH